MLEVVALTAGCRLCGTESLLVVSTDLCLLSTEGSEMSQFRVLCSGCCVLGVQSVVFRVFRMLCSGCCVQGVVFRVFRVLCSGCCIQGVVFRVFHHSAAGSTRSRLMERLYWVLRGQHDQYRGSVSRNRWLGVGSALCSSSAVRVYM